MHGTEHRISERRALSPLAPRQPVSPATASSPSGTPQLFSKTGPFARNGLSLARNGLRLRGSHSGVNGPGLLLRSLACRSSCPFGFLAPPPDAGSPQFLVASSPQARCIPYRPALPTVPPTSAPRREFSLPPDQSFNWLRNRSVRLPESPDLRSLPAAFPFKVRLRITVPDPLRSRRLAARESPRSRAGSFPRPRRAHRVGHDHVARPLRPRRGQDRL